MQKYVNGELVDLTAEEIQQVLEDQASDKSAIITKGLEDYYDFRLNGGIVVSGMNVKSTETSRGLINGAVTRALIENDLAIVHTFFAPDGTEVPLTNAQFIGLGIALAEHAQKCLAARAEIKDVDFETIEQLQAAFDAAYNQ